MAELQAAAAPQLQVAEGAVAAALAQRQIVQADLDLLQAGATSAELAVAEAQVQQAQVGVDSARLALERATLTAPFAGVVARVEVAVGGSAGPQLPAVTLLGDSQFTIEADVDEADIGWIQLGQAVQITFDAFPEREQAGTVVAIAPLATIDLGIVSYRVTIDAGASDLPLRAGMTANVEIVRQSRENVLLVPNLAISVDPETGLKYVDRKAASGGLEQVEITTGLATEQYSEVLSGLAEGDSVAVGSLSAREQFREIMGASLPGSQ